MQRFLFPAAAFLAFATPAIAQAQPILGAEAEYQRVASQARAAYNAGRYSQALLIGRDAHAFAAAELGPDHILTLRALNDIAVIYQLQGNFDAALPLALEAAGKLERIAGPDHVETLNALGNLGQLQMARGDAAAAEPLLRRVLEGRTRTLGAGNEATLNAMLELAVFMKRQGRLRELGAQLDRAAATARAETGADSAISLDLANAAAEANGRPAPSPPAAG